MPSKQKSAKCPGCGQAIGRHDEDRFREKLVTLTSPEYAYRDWHIPCRRTWERSRGVVSR